MVKNPLFLAGASFLASRLFAGIEAPRGQPLGAVALLLKTVGVGGAVLLCALSIMAALVAAFRQLSAARSADALEERREPAWDVSETHATSAREWTLELLRELEWKRVERLAALYFRELGFRVEEADFGPDGGIDLRLYPKGASDVGILVKCKAWNSWRVGVKEIRELFGVMAAEGVREGIFLTTSTFTPDAVAFAQGKDITLIDGEDFVRKLRDLPAERGLELLLAITAGNYRTPTCPSCGERMVMRYGCARGESFWGCRSFPACRATIQVPGMRSAGF